MTTLREAAAAALEALGLWATGRDIDAVALNDLIFRLEAALAEPVQEPVAWKDKTYESLHHQDFGNSIPLYTAPPQRKPLTDDEIDKITVKQWGRDFMVPSAGRAWARAIEKEHGIGNE